MKHVATRRHNQQYNIVWRENKEGRPSSAKAEPRAKQNKNQHNTTKTNQQQNKYNEMPCADQPQPCLLVLVAMDTETVTVHDSCVSRCREEERECSRVR